MVLFGLGAVTGAIILGLVLRNNPKLADKLLKVTDKLEELIDDKLKKK